MTEPAFLESDAVLFLHDQSVREYGGLHGVRDEGLLQSALARAANKLDYGEPGSVDLFALAAAYAFGIARNHPFNDGNKRTAWASCTLFLKLNGAVLVAPAPEIIERVVGLAAGQIDEAAFAAWLRDRCGASG